MSNSENEQENDGKNEPRTGACWLTKADGTRACYANYTYKSCQDLGQSTGQPVQFLPGQACPT